MAYGSALRMRALRLTCTCFCFLGEKTVSSYRPSTAGDGGGVGAVLVEGDEKPWPLVVEAAVVAVAVAVGPPTCKLDIMPVSSPSSVSVSAGDLRRRRAERRTGEVTMVAS